MSGLLYLRRQPPAFDVLLDGEPIGTVRRDPDNRWEAWTVEGARCVDTATSPDGAATILHEIHGAVTA
jgi:hypothetical protein